MDYLEIQSFCGFDLDRANAMAARYDPLDLAGEVREVENVEKVEPEPTRADRRGLHRPVSLRGDRAELGHDPRAAM